MINEIAIAFEAGYITGIFFMIFIIAVAVLIEKRGKKPFCKKPKDENDDDCWICPRCGAGVGWYDMKEKYCSDCGQKIDWSE